MRCDPKKRRRGSGILSAACLFLTVLFCLSVPVRALSPSPDSSAETVRPSVTGALHVEGTSLTDTSGKAVQLRGVSTHGLTWFPEYIDPSFFRQISEDWNCNLIRLAMYSELYCGEEREENLSLMRKGIDAAIEADMYVLVDWHILNDSDPNQHIEEALAFFELISTEYASVPNLLYEICNEPNGETDWGHVLAYSQKVIPVIRRNSPEAVVVVGTPEYDRNLGGPALRPLPYENVMYVLHFYAASHGEGLMGEMRAAVEAGVPVFISECGICESSGDGRIDFASAAEWFSYLAKQKISYAVWSLSDKDETSAFFRPGTDPTKPIKDADLTVSGLWVRELIRGANPDMIPSPAASLGKSAWAGIRSWISDSIGEGGYRPVSSWLSLAGIAGGIFLLSAAATLLYRRFCGNKRRTYGDIIGRVGGKKRSLPTRLCLFLSVFFTLLYLGWRIRWSIPLGSGIFAVVCSLLLLVVETVGFAESLVLYRNLIGAVEHSLPDIPSESWPEVDVFIATYNESPELLRKTVNGCLHMKYPDAGKVHIWICDDNRRPAMRALAEEMGVGYFDRPDNKGAKAGNLNHAMGLTCAPYIVTFDADMIPKSDFLLKTIPYFVDADLREAARPVGERLRLGLLQTPQSFYDPDVFQYALYSEKRVPNEQDFFYRTVEPAKTTTNSVIYGGSNTVLARRALEEIGGFYTESITEDFATGILIESAGYVSLAIPEPLASGQTPHTFREHIAQRVRWGRGVIVTARKLKIWRRKNFSLAQRINYWSSVAFWYSPLKNLIYMLSPLLYAVFAVPVFRCTWLDMAVFWLPMFVFQDLCLRLNSGNSISTKWSGIYETSVMPHLLIPIIKESLGISLTSFRVTDKSQKIRKRKRDVRGMLPFLVLTVLSVAGIVRILTVFDAQQTFSFLILLFWVIRNLYFLIMALFLVDGRDSDEEVVRVTDAEPVVLRSGKDAWEGITTQLTEHNLNVYLDEGQSLGIGAECGITILREDGDILVKGVVTGIREARHSTARAHTVEILDFCGNRYEYLELLYDRIPTLPQSLRRDFGVLSHLWQNIAHRVARTRQ